jgi:hypothetical protein
MLSDAPSLTRDTFNVSNEKPDRLYDVEDSSKDRTEALKEKRAMLEIANIELELKERSLALKAKELEHKKRARDVEYESIDKAVDRYSAYCSSGDSCNIDGLDEQLKAKYRRMLDEA